MTTSLRRFERMPSAIERFGHFLQQAVWAEHKEYVRVSYQWHDAACRYYHAVKNKEDSFVRYCFTSAEYQYSIQDMTERHWQNQIRRAMQEAGYGNKEQDTALEVVPLQEQFHGPTE